MSEVLLVSWHTQVAVVKFIGDDGGDVLVERAVLPKLVDYLMLVVESRTLRGNFQVVVLHQVGTATAEYSVALI